MLLFEKIVGVIAPHTCIGCKAEENLLLCISCTQCIAIVPSRCYRCKAVTENYAVCLPCRAKTPLRRVVVHTYHQGLAKELIHRTKYERAKQGASEMAVLMKTQLEAIELPLELLVVPVPTATTRVRSRGYDHAKLIATGVASGRMPMTPVLIRIGQAHQVGARRAERLRQLAGAFQLARGADVRGKHVLLVDDVVTTGATLESAARVLRQAGAKQVDAVVFAQA